MSEDTDRDAILREIAKKKVVYEMPGMDLLRVRGDLTYRSTQGTEIPMDVYYPSVPPGHPLPTVLFPMAYPDPTARVRAYGPVTSWARLIAASGIAAVVYGAAAPEEDALEVLRQLRSEGEVLGLDIARVGLFATSANVTVALSTLIRDRRLTCAALLYGVTMDTDGSTIVADMGRQTGFVDACVGKSPDELPDDIPMLFIRAGRDHFPGLNDALDKVIARAIARNLPLSLINHATGAHGFDLDEHTALSRGIVQQVLSFLQLHLGVERWLNKPASELKSGD